MQQSLPERWSWHSPSFEEADCISSHSWWPPWSPHSSQGRLYTQSPIAEEFQGIPLQFSATAIAGVTVVARAFVINLKTEVNKRFPPTDVQVLRELGTILDPSHLPQEQDQTWGHGEDALERLLARYTETKCRGSRMFLQAVQSSPWQPQKSLKDRCKHIITECDDRFPELSNLSHFTSNTCPLSAWWEGLFLSPYDPHSAQQSSHCASSGPQNARQRPEQMKWE